MMLLHFAISTSERKKTQVASLCKLCDDHVHYSDSYWWDKLCSNDGQTTLHNNNNYYVQTHTNITKIQTKKLPWTSVSANKFLHFNLNIHLGQLLLSFEQLFCCLFSTLVLWVYTVHQLTHIHLLFSIYKKIPVPTANKVLSKAIVHPSSLNLVWTGP